ncbi:DinB family protein [Aureibacillus halotolerans]|uniref:Putative damage-inducible protein DinB n=1 Tax=Aureibacillus halotolerans TaxID=1508390 RepID=A0A4R6TQZ9_9BACI|nr:DinB family protein [Aureibacillus halotolerans]TDQ35399.1 putative damage-inducible protein DinB [Aureibacillus halotolerans]
MLTLFQYNWQVREDWFSWCEGISEEELLKQRVGGPGSLLYTLFHIVDVEYSWLVGLQGKEEPEEPPFEHYATLQKVKQLSHEYHMEVVRPFVKAWTDDMEAQTLSETNANGETISFRHGEVMRHVIAHEIHHVGQLSVWAREIGKPPITANLINRGLFDKQ